MSRSDTIRFLALRTLGNFLVLVALYGVVEIFGPAVGYELQYQVIQLKHVQFTVVNERVPKVSEVSKVSANDKNINVKVLQ